MSGLVLLFFLFRCQDFCYDHMRSQSLQICFLSIRSCHFNWMACVTLIFTLSGANFFVHSRDLVFGHTWLTSLLNDFLTLNLTFIFLRQGGKLRWVCVILIEGYLRAANRSSCNLYRFLIKIEHLSLQKNVFFWRVSVTVFRLHILKAVGAIFWQSDSYVLVVFAVLLLWFCLWLPLIYKLFHFIFVFLHLCAF